MNKFVNILLFLLTLPIIGFSLIVGFDLPIEMLKLSGANMPYQQEIFFAFAALVLLIGGRRSIRRWMGVRMVKKIKKFKWNKEMSKERYRQANLYLILEFVLHAFVGVTLYVLTPLVFPVALVFMILAADHLIFAIVARVNKLFRVGMTSKAIVVADRNIKAIYLKGLQEVSVQQQSLFFDYVEELQLDFPISCIEEENREEFKDQLTKLIDRKRVHYSESFKNF